MLFINEQYCKDCFTGTLLVRLCDFVANLVLILRITMRKQVVERSQGTSSERIIYWVPKEAYLEGVR